MDFDFPVPLISATAAIALSGQTQLRFVDASWFLPQPNEASQKDGLTGFLAGHIKGAVFFDIDLHCAPDTNLPHMAPSPEQFSLAMGNLGISSQDKIIVYDQIGIFSGPRFWWLARLMGHKNIAVLDGGLPAWIGAGGALAEGVATPKQAQYQANFQLHLVVDIEELEARRAQGQKVADARPAARFLGQAPEPRPNLSAGHMPNAYNIPFGQVLNGPTGTLKSDAELADIFAPILSGDAPPILSCGSGVTACVLALGLAKIGHWDCPIYDGAWAQWGQIFKQEIATQKTA